MSDRLKMVEHEKLDNLEHIDLPEQTKQDTNLNNDVVIPPDGGFQVKIL